MSNKKHKILEQCRNRFYQRTWWGATPCSAVKEHTGN